MALFSLFGTKPMEENQNTSIEAPVEQETEDTVKTIPSNEESQESKQKVITIHWGTGMPIDIIFAFVHKDFEDEGYQDALISSDLQYRDAKEKIIRNDLKMLFMRISLRYKNDLREIGVQIDNAQKAYALSSASLLQARCESYNEHLAKIEEMESLLDADDPKMMTMIESYRRGFLKGITAKTLQFINNNHN